MKLLDCEISHRVIRGQNVAFIFGDRALDDAERADMLAQFLAAYGAVQAPAYASPDGWQTLEAPGALAGRFVFDEAGNEVRIDGLRVKGEVIDTFTTLSKPGEWFRIVGTDNEVITIERRVDDVPPAAGKKAKA